MGDFRSETFKWERFEELLVSISSGFIDIRLEQIDAAVVKSLELICTMLEIDRCYIDAYDAEKSISTMLYEWTACPAMSGIADSASIVMQDYGWWNYLHENGLSLVVHDAEKLPAMAWREKAYYKRKHIRSDIEVKMHYADKLIGFLGFNTFNAEKIWREDEIRRLKVLGEIMCGVLYRKTMEESNLLKLELDELLIGISTEFIAIPSAQLDKAIGEALKRIAQRIGSDRSYVYLMDADKRMQLVYEWHEQGIPVIEHSPERSLGDYTWWDKASRCEDGLNFATPDELPAYAVLEKQFYHEIGTISNIEANLYFSGELLGFIGFESVGQVRHWDKCVMNMLQLLSEIFASALLRKQTEEKLVYMSFHDALTGLRNRADFERMLAKLDDPAYLPLSIINGDVNGLKLVNDTFGHQQGDSLLQLFAKILQEVASDSSLVFRWGGDEFIIMLPLIGIGAAENMAKMIRERCSLVEEFPLQLSVSLGISERTSMDTGMSELLREVEDRMYQNKLLEHRSVRSALVFSLRESLAEKTLETEAHSRRLFELSLKIGESIGLGSSEMDKLNVLAVLHDIGKVAIPEHIIEKPGRLTDTEWEIIKQHPAIGYRIASSSQDLLGIADGILAHHERWDGTGYPSGLAGENIPLISRVLAIADSFDVMVHGRPYKQAISVEDALAEIRRCAGSQFDPRLAEVFIELMSK